MRGENTAVSNRQFLHYDRFAHPMNVFKNLLNRKSSSSSQPTTSSQNFLQSVEDNLSPEISGAFLRESVLSQIAMFMIFRFSVFFFRYS